jgi:hypothetical protein
MKLTEVWNSLSSSLSPDDLLLYTVMPWKISIAKLPDLARKTFFDIGCA